MKIPQQARKPQNMSHWILGSVLLLIAAFLIVAIAYVNTHASTNTQVTVTNSPPSISAMALNSSSTYSGTSLASVSITPEGIHHVYINGTVTDPNGYGDISLVEGVFQHYGAVDCPNTTNDFDCYHVMTCTLSGGSGTSENYSCDVPVNFYADATDSGLDEDPTDSTLGDGTAVQGWLATIAVTDSASHQVHSDGSGGRPGPVFTEVAAQGDLHFPTTIDFTTLASGSSTTTSTNVTKAILQGGNEEEDMKVLGTDLTGCTAGSIPVGDLEYIDGHAHANADQGTVNSHPVAVTDSSQFLDVPRQTSSSVSSENTYWNLTVPSGVVGACSGTVTMTAIAH